jgi:Predicted AAA-ATPase/PD-(D/E)XK nuclease superfamily
LKAQNLKKYTHQVLENKYTLNHIAEHILLMKKLPIGIQTLAAIIKDHYLYVDKTEQIYTVINRGKYFFLSRPRRFGKSLLISTLKEIFSGNKELFKDLWIGNSNYEWVRYPVIYIDFSIIAHRTPAQFESSLIEYLLSIATEYSIDIEYKTTPEGVLGVLVKSLFNTYGPVVVLIDEYDKPILDHISNIGVAHKQQAILRGFYAAIKGLDAYLRFIFMTGITKFSKTSVFSGLNNLQDLTLDPSTGALLGYTQAEVESYFTGYIATIAKQQNSTVQTISQNAQSWYNGYQFSEKNVRVYNPYSILLYLSEGRLLNYWFETGTPSFLVNLIKTKEYSIESIENVELNIQDMGSFELDDIRLMPLLFQTGYLTIKSYDALTQNYVLDYPNEETKVSFLHYFASSLTTAPVSLFNSSILRLIQALKNNDMDLFFQTLEVFFAAMPYTMQLSQEKYYQSIFYVIVQLIGAYIHAEVATSEGRIDATIETQSHVYIFEFKLDQSAQKALNQIKEKRYYQKYVQTNQSLPELQHLRKHIILVGASFSLAKRNIDTWLVEKLS